jgi:hypothetical protein
LVQRPDIQSSKGGYEVRQLEQKGDATARMGHVCAVNLLTPTEPDHAASLPEL